MSNITDIGQHLINEIEKVASLSLEHNLLSRGQVNFLFLQESPNSIYHGVARLFALHCVYTIYTLGSLIIV